jgi:energy-coupling factor transport system substrate-specific component
VGAIIGLLGHALGDAIFYGSVWWSWVFPEAVVGIAIGAFAKKFAVRDGGFDKKNIILFNIVQIVANAIAWIGLAPMLDIIVYAEPASKVFIQGIFAFIGDIIIIGVLGTLLLVAYSKVAGKSSSLKKED